MATPSSSGTEPVTKQVAVVGAGVIGLSTALRLLLEGGTPDAKVEVTIIADRFTPNTTSDGSGGFWEPYALGNTPISSIRKWSKATWDHFHELCRSRVAQEIGAQFVSGYTLHNSGSPEEPLFKDIVLGYRPVTERELQELFPFATWGFFHTTLQVSVQAYLPWLTERFKAKGGKLENATVKELSDLADRFDIIINCCGPRAGQLGKDTQTEPIRGQVLRVRAPWIKHHYIMETGNGTITYVLPLGDTVVVGGVAQRGNWNENVDGGDTRAIWERAVTLFPQLQNAERLNEWAGLRPGRTTVRLEAQAIETPNKRVLVIHNYGHGGAGITLHWGCAGDVVHVVNHALNLMCSKQATSKL